MKGQLYPATFALISFLTVSSFASQVFAKPSDVPSAKNPSVRVTATPTVTPTSAPRPSAVVFSQVRLTGGPLQACQAREQVLQNRLTNLMRMANTMLSTFDGIATRVETFYSDKVLPGGKTVSNYDALVGDVQKAKAQVQTDLTTTQNDANGFNCTSIDPKGHLTQFRIDMQEVKSSLKEYRTTIKNLIVAVHQVASESATPTPTPTP